MRGTEWGGWEVASTLKGLVHHAQVGFPTRLCLGGQGDARVAGQPLGALCAERSPEVPCAVAEVYDEAMFVTRSGLIFGLVDGAGEPLDSPGAGEPLDSPGASSDLAPSEPADDVWAVSLRLTRCAG